MFRTALRSLSRTCMAVAPAASVFASQPVGILPSNAASSLAESRTAEKFVVGRVAADGTVQRVPLETALAACSQANVVLLGEVHDDPVAHEFELHLVRELAARRAAQSWALSLEMFERDVQPVVDEYLNGTIRLQDLLQDARAWPNFSKDYQPLVDFAKSQRAPVIAANAPRRYVGLVGRGGLTALHTLSPAMRTLLGDYTKAAPSAALRAKFMSWMAPPPEASATSDPPTDSSTPAHEQSPSKAPAPSASTEAVTNSHSLSPSASSESKANASTEAKAGVCPYVGLSRLDNMLAAQVLWDHTMAHSIAESLRSHPGRLVVHVTGAFHCEGRLGIPEQLARLHAGPLRVVVVVVRPVPPEVLAALQAEGPDAASGPVLAEPGTDFVVLSDESLQRSFDSIHPV